MITETHSLSNGARSSDIYAPSSSNVRCTRRESLAVVETRAGNSPSK